MELQQPSRTYRPHMVERWTIIPKLLSNEWKVEPIPDGKISSIGFYDSIEVSFGKEILALETFDIVLPRIVVEGTAYTFPPVNYLKVRIRGSFVGCEDNAAARVLHPNGPQDGPRPCVEFY